MGLIVCHSCERQRVISPIKRLIYTCSNCGAKNPRIIRRRKVWANWDDIDGKDKTEALRATYAGLKWLTENKGFKPKYPDAKFRSIFGYWPSDEICQVPSYPPSPALLNWIARSNAAWKRVKALEEKERQPNLVIRLPKSGDNEGVQDELVSSASPLMTEEDWNVKL